MSRDTYVFRGGAWVPRHTAMPRYSGKPSDLACPMVITDTMAPTQSMLDGKMYDSKAAIRATYRAAGVTEVGNEPVRPAVRVRPTVDRAELKTSLEKATARFERGERAGASAS